MMADMSLLLLNWLLILFGLPLVVGIPVLIALVQVPDLLTPKPRRPLDNRVSWHTEAAWA
jgi:hypothetical protein